MVWTGRGGGEGSEAYGINKAGQVVGTSWSPRLGPRAVLWEGDAGIDLNDRVGDGSPWRPIVHVEDICRAFLAVLEAPRKAVHDQAFNVGRTDENYRVSELAEIVRQTVPGCRIEYAAGGGPDKRCYRVDCSKIARLVPGFRPRWDVRRGVQQLYKACRSSDLTVDDLGGQRYFRLQTLQGLLDGGLLDSGLRWQVNGVSGAGPEMTARCGTVR